MKRRAAAALVTGGGGQRGGLPRGIAAIQDSEPTHVPGSATSTTAGRRRSRPRRRRRRPGRLVDAPAREHGLARSARGGQRVASIQSGARRREVRVEVGVERARDVFLKIGAAAPGRIREIGAAIDDRPGCDHPGGWPAPRVRSMGEEGDMGPPSVAASIGRRQADCQPKRRPIDRGTQCRIGRPQPTVRSNGPMTDGPAFQDFYAETYAQCYGCGRLNEHGLHIRSRWEGDETVCTFVPRPEHTAIPGFVYGGLIASLIDCHSTGTAAGRCAAGAGRRRLERRLVPRFVTGSLHVDYLRPTPLGPTLEIRGSGQGDQGTQSGRFVDAQRRWCGVCARRGRGGRDPGRFRRRRRRLGRRRPAAHRCLDDAGRSRETAALSQVVRQARQAAVRNRPGPRQRRTGGASPTRPAPTQGDCRTHAGGRCGRRPRRVRPRARRELVGLRRLVSLPAGIGASSA